jgi:hypothetical protein
VSTKVEKAMSSVGLRGLRHLLLRPWTFDVTSNVSWIEHGPVFNVRAKSENFRLDVGPNHILAYEAVQVTISLIFYAWNLRL